MDKKQFEEQTYIDRRGYRYWKNSGKSVHRGIAKHKIWEKDRKKYPLEFKEYQVHHKNKDKLDNNVENLELIQIREHELSHNIHRHEYSVISTLFIFLVVVFSWFIYLGRVTGYTYDIKGVVFMLSTTIIGGFLLWFVNRKKKGRRYV